VDILPKLVVCEELAGELVRTPVDPGADVSDEGSAGLLLDDALEQRVPGHFAHKLPCSRTGAQGRMTVEPMGSKGAPAAALRERAARVIPRTWLVEI